MVLSHDANCWTDDILPALRKAGVSEDQLYPSASPRSSSSSSISKRLERSV